MNTLLSQPTIAFIGAGNMTRCLISGLIANHYPKERLWTSNPSVEKLHFLEKQFGIHTTCDNYVAAKQAEIVVFAVKPQMMFEVACALADIIQQKKPLIISVASGVTTVALSKWLGDETAIVRTMPNIPAFEGSGATGIYANNKVSALQRDLAETVFRAVGVALWVDNEAHIDSIAALSGSGPAYFFYVMEALEASAVSLGLSQEDAHILTLQTALGAAKLALSTNEPLSTLRERVTSKGGITERALAVLASQQVRSAFESALKAAHDHSITLAMQFGKT